jgi:hypothetical protein
MVTMSQKSSLLQVARSVSQALTPNSVLRNSCNLRRVVATIGLQEIFAMATDTTVRARIDERVKKEAAHVLGDMGLSVSDAI